MIAGVQDSVLNSPSYPLTRLHGYGPMSFVVPSQTLGDLSQGENPPSFQDPALSAPAGSYVDAYGNTILPDTNVDPTRTTAWYDVLGQLQQANLDIQELEDAIRQNAFDSAFAPAARDVLAARNKFNEAADQFSTAYRAMFGEVPAGLAGELGQVAQATIYAAVLTAVVYALYVINQYIQSGRDKIALARSQSANRADLLAAADTKDKQAAAAQSKGDITTARALANEAAQLRQQVGDPSAPSVDGSGKASDWNTWIQKNALWIGLGFGAIVLGPKLIKKL